MSGGWSGNWVWVRIIVPDLLLCVLCLFGGYVGQFPIVVGVFRRYGDVWEGLGSEVVGVSRGL